MSEPLFVTRARTLVAPVRAFIAGLSRPMRILMLTTIGAAIAIIGYFGWTASHENYVPIFAQLDQEDASSVVAKLKEQKIPYRLSETGNTVEVPESKVHEVRLELAGAGLPRGGGVGFESFDKMHLGATEFEQRVLFRRALEGELARTIGSLAAVESARVHLVLPEKSVFITRSEPASGTIVVKMRAGRTLGAPEVGAIVHLAAAAVPGLAPESVALVTTDGTMLHKPRKTSTEDGAGGLDPDAASDRQAMESNVEDRVRALLERIVGHGHVDVRVSAEIDSARVEHVEDHYDPTKTAMRSVDETIERTTSDTSVAGVPGAESNTPQGVTSGATATPSAPNVVREQHTRNFEIDHVSDKRTQAGGGLRRLTVAVVVDGVHGAPRSKEDIAQLTGLVASAAGADVKRGDVVTVESVPFFDPEVAVAPAGPAPVAMPTKAALLRSRWTWIGAAALAIVLIAVAGFAMRSRGRRAEQEKVIAQIAAAKTAHALPTGATEGEEPHAQLDRRGEAMALAAKDPATAALVLRAWLGGTSTSDATAA